ncbi:aliphatic sulfonate ABC transporter substrate-binding protein [Methylovirgula sp. 4M-Z18]|uniref:aliphatic sulfonate ABC transporter substrate-binding protein n=1 Tax=Methylovirgula sp. 4M-Z18 TaxID=2293567 RepID=UPI000E2F05EC|nr:aliphatic sulfonate ABC transporter substrate-binding protein [Methylovirgula sp. 4M-Z18]RFB80064.1 aliphatic sulfonate ABC transporter substrate-binding protein [Methylovirgula sp. 4M-Z18]
MNRRTWLKFTLGAGVSALGHPLLARAAGPTELRIGYQKSGVLLVAKQQGLLDKHFASRGISVKWVEFSYGPPLLEALNAGGIDYGATGDAPPIFAQAARANLLYVAVLPSGGSGQAILVPRDSAIQTLADLKGKKVGFAKASSAHNLVLSALESANISYSEITPVYLAPADAAAAFARGAIDAWAIWDPYYAIAEKARPIRALPVPKSALVQNSFFLANRDFTQKNPDIVAGVNEELAKASSWIVDHRDETAKLFAEATGVDLAAQITTVQRSEFAFSPITETVATQQQAVADRFAKLNLIPSPINVRDIIWTWKPGA